MQNINRTDKRHPRQRIHDFEEAEEALKTSRIPEKTSHYKTRFDRREKKRRGMPASEANEEIMDSKSSEVFFLVNAGAGGGQ